MAAGNKGGPFWALGSVSDGAVVRAATVQSDGARIFALGPVAQSDAVQDSPEMGHGAVMSGFAGVDLIGIQDGKPFDPRVLAEALGVPVVSDFAGADRELGGAGEPLTPFFLFACAQWIAAKGPVMFVDLGPVVRICWVDPMCGAPELPGGCLAFDAGPGGGGAIGGDGTPDEAVLVRFLAQAHFARIPPKLLNPTEFDWLDGALSGMSAADANATRNACVALALADALSHLPKPPLQVLLTGPGRTSPSLVAMIAGSLDCPVAPCEAAGLTGDMIGAQAIAHLAVRVARGMTTTCPTTTGVAAAVGGGQISAPEG